MSFMSNVYSDENQLYVLKNPEKYKGKTLPVIRSSWEGDLFKWCDMNPSIVAWVSEPIGISYHDPSKRKQRRYYPDLLIQVRSPEGKDNVFLVEVKPYKQTQQPVATPRKKKSVLINEQLTWLTNKAKWHAAEALCRQKGWKFQILTEEHIYGRKKS